MASKKKYRKDIQQAKQPIKATPAKTEPRRKIGLKPLLPGSWQINAGIFLLLLIATLVLYSSDLHLGFFGVDDPGYVTDNPWIKGMNGKNLNYIFSHPYFANYSPLHLLSYMIDYRIAGSNAYAFHLSSNIWAGIAAGFVFLVGLALTSNRIIAVAAAVLFIVHPVHVEAVAWISSRKDLVAVAFVLPSLLAYLYYRRGGDKARRWYFLSLLLFICALLGKLSVATFPAVFLAIDYFIEKRPLSRTIVDKLPFFAAALIIGMVVSSVQPQMGHKPNGFVLLQAALQNLWLLTGFGKYVIYRVAPDEGADGMQALGILVLLVLFVLPFFLRKKLPLVAVIIYWMLFAFIPSQVLSFTHPVTDRYLFFPSVAIVILIAWGVITAIQKFGQKALIASLSLMAILAFFWASSTLKYLKEWKDPRSVWYAAAKKSSDPAVPQNLGSHYVELSRKFNAGVPDSLFSQKEKKRLAELMWSNDPRLSKLIAEWNEGKKNGPVEKEFQDHIRTEALDAFTKAIQNKGDRVMPGIYYNRGSILLDRGDWEGAKKEFQATLEEVSRESFREVKEQLTVYCYYGFGIIEFRQGKYANAKDWYEKAKTAQDQFGRNWIPRLPDDIKRVEQLMNSQ